MRFEDAKATRRKWFPTMTEAVTAPQMASNPTSLLIVGLRTLVLEAFAFGLVIGAVWLLLSLGSAS